MPTNDQATAMRLAASAAKTYTTNRLMAYAQLDPDLTIRQVSPNFVPMALPSPLPAEEILNQQLPDVLWEFVGITQALHDVLSGKARLFQLEHVNREQPDGSINYLTFSVYRLEPDTNLSGLLLLVEDTTEYGRLHHKLIQDRNELRLVQSKLAAANRELTRIDRMKSLFLSMAAHDLRTPLSAIQGYSEMLLSGITELGSPKSLDYLDIIYHQSTRLNQLIDDVVDLDLIEQGKLTLHPTRCDVNALIQEILTALKFSLERRGIIVHNNLATEPMMIQADSEKILRVFYNLIGNANKYVARNGEIGLYSQKLDDKIIIEIEDNGPGMSEAQLNNLFVLYYRSEEAEKSAVKGSGLGLFIVKTIVEAHQGTINVTSQPGRGSKFTVQLPAIPSLAQETE